MQVLQVVPFTFHGVLVHSAIMVDWLSFVVVSDKLAVLLHLLVVVASLSRLIHEVSWLDLPELKLLEEQLTFSQAPELWLSLLGVPEVLDQMAEGLSISIQEQATVFLDQRLEHVVLGKERSQETVLV